MEWLWNKFVGFAAWLVDLVSWAVVEAFELLLSGVAAILVLIPVPDNVADALAAWAALDPGIVWGLSILEIPTGLTIVFGAYLIRFAIRRLPFVG